jgi:hypothetical protein
MSELWIHPSLIFLIGALLLPLVPQGPQRPSCCSSRS